MSRGVGHRAAALLRVGLMGAVGLVGLSATACAPSSPASAPSGVDGLVVPLALPDPDDFGPVLDSRWLTTGADAGAADTAVAGPVVDGVATTEVAGNGGVDYYAQDLRGNVWWFGREGVWVAGEEGAEAGLVITDTPRLGDGYQSALAPAADVDLVSEVVELGADLEVGSTSYDDAVVVDTRDVATDRVQRVWYVAGVGRVQTQLLLP